MQAHESNLLIVNWKTSCNLKIDPIIIIKKKNARSTSYSDRMTN